MIQTKFTIDKDNNINGEGSLRKALSYLKHWKSLSDNIKKTVILVNEIHNEYVSAVSNDGHIIGIERSDLFLKIQVLFELCIVLWKNADNNKEECYIELANPDDPDFHFSITESNKKWKARGILSEDFFEKAPSFKSIYDKKVYPALRSFLSLYREVCEDHKVDQDERKQLKKSIEHIMYTVLFLHIQVEKCLIDS